MGRFVALYRGINVGGHHPVRMGSLRAMHERLGHRDVASYVQSGNVVFSTRESAASIARRIAPEFAGQFGFAARVIVIGAERWRAVVHDNPFAAFSAKDPRTVHVAFGDTGPDAKGLMALHQRTGGSERIVTKANVIYLHAPDGFGTSKFAAGMEKACGVPITVRNWRTVESLLEML
jgi:uncharacterized protein (DUF1697 family)